VPFEKTSDGVTVRLRLTPGASRDLITGVAKDENGVAWLAATVTAVPKNGRANKAMIRLLSKQWRLAKSSIQVISGETARRKILLVSGDADAIMDKLSVWSRDRILEKT
jgi:uncharacterized protein (TIGR00251 family)